MTFAPLAVTTFVGVVIAVVVVLAVLLFIGGILAVRARDRRQAGTWREHVAAADQALEDARAADRGWHPETMEAAARQGLAESRPGFPYDDLHLILVEDRPGTDEDRARYVAMGDEGEVQVVLKRDGDAWSAESVE